MATMWPKRLPTWVEGDPRRAAEISVYAKLERILPASWDVYYSRPWWGLSKTGGEVEGEADFVLVHPDKGILFLEVKGGAIAYDPTRERWTSTDRNGVTHNIKDPIRQASTCKHRFLGKFKDCAGWPVNRVRMRHGAVFPHCDTSREAPRIGPYERELFCCASEFGRDFATWLDARLGSHAPNDPECGPGAAGARVVESVIAQPARLSVPLHVEVHGELAAQDALLSGAQLLAICSIGAYRRVIIEGGAGTGKTLIASELASRDATNNKQVLLCCSSHALAAHLQRRLRDRNVVVLTVAALAAFPGRQWDTVIVDEGQDLLSEHWDLVEGVVGPSTDLRVFFDSNQAIYRTRDDLETRLGAEGFPLRLNLRNTKRIAALTEKLYRGPLIEVAGPDGETPAVIDVPVEAAIDRAAYVAKRAIVDESVPAADVALLVPDDAAITLVRKALATSGVRVTDAMDRQPGAMVVERVDRFKGLEAAIVILVVDWAIAMSPELAYVAVSRARSRLVISGVLNGTRLGDAVTAAFAGT